MKKLNIFFLVFASLVASCHHDNEDLGYKKVEAPHWTLSEPNQGSLQGSTIDWVVLDETKNIMSTMTVVGMPPEIPNTSVSETDKIAFFADGECLGVTNPKLTTAGDWRYILNLYKPKSTAHAIVMGYYSASTKRVCYWTDCFNYRTDAIVGTVDKPFKVSTRSSNYALEISTQIGLPNSLLGKVGNGDEMAVFCGDECRGVLTWDSVEGFYRGKTGMSAETEKFVVKYYNASEKRLYTSAEFEESIYDVVIYFSAIDLK